MGRTFWVAFLVWVLIILLLSIVVSAMRGSEPRDFIFFVSPLPPPPLVQPSAPVPPKTTLVPKTDTPNKAEKITSVNVEQVASILGSCVRCHSAGDAKPKTKPIVLFNEAGDFNPTVKPAEVYAAVADDSMPLSGPKLSARDKDLIRRWAGVTKSEVTQ